MKRTSSSHCSCQAAYPIDLLVYLLWSSYLHKYIAECKLRFQSQRDVFSRLQGCASSNGAGHLSLKSYTP